MVEERARASLPPAHSFNINHSSMYCMNWSWAHPDLRWESLFLDVCVFFMKTG